MYGVQSTRRNCSFFGAASTATVKAATSNIPSKCIYPGRRIDRINFALGWLFIILSLSADHFTPFKAFITGTPEPRFFVQLMMLSQHILGPNPGAPNFNHRLSSSFIPYPKHGTAQNVSTQLITLIECIGCTPYVELSSAFAHSVLTVLSSLLF